MSQLSRLVICCLVAMAFGAAASEAKADPLTFNNLAALQNNGLTRVNLLANPGVTLYGSSLSFLVDIQGTVPAGAASLLQITFTQAGSAPIVQTLNIPAFSSVSPPYSQFFTFNTSGASAQGTPATLTITIITPPSFSTLPAPGNFLTHTYTFNIAQPVPEPATMVLLGSGIAGLLAGVRRRRRRPRVTV